MTEPMLRQLAADGHELTVAALPWVAPVYKAMPQVSNLEELPFRHGGLQWQMRRDIAKNWRGRFDSAFVCPNSFKSALMPYWAGISNRVGYLGEYRYFLLNQRLTNLPKKKRGSMVEFYFAMAQSKSLGLSKNPATSLTPKLKISVDDLEKTLVKSSLQQDGYWIFAPGAEYGPAKRWPLEQFAEVARHARRPVVLLGSSKEVADCEAICQMVQSETSMQIKSLAGQTSLYEAMALIAGAHRVLSNDSGLMHIAAAFGVNQVAVFGSSDPHHTPPLNSNAQVIWLKDDPDYQPKLDCSPCFKRNCPLGHTRCLLDIRPDRVLRALS